MARIIKGQKDSAGATCPVPSQESIKYAEGGRIIDKDFYRAQLLVRDILKEGELKRRAKLEAARKIVAQTKEEALAGGATEAFNEAGKKAIDIFAQRASYLSNVSMEVRALAQEIVQKILGGPLRLDRNRQNEILLAGIHRMRAKRKLRLQCTAETLNAMRHMAAEVVLRVEKDPDIEFEEISDIRAGCFRIVTDAGSALCHQSAAIAALQKSSHE